MPYLTQAQFEARFGSNELNELLEGGSDYTAASSDADSLINGYLAARYSLPLASVPVIVQGWAADVTRFRLWDDHAPEEVRRRYDDALAQLKLLSQGVISLPPDAQGNQVGGSLAFGGYSAERVFTSSTLEGY